MLDGLKSLRTGDADCRLATLSYTPLRPLGGLLPFLTGKDVLHYELTISICASLSFHVTCQTDFNEIPEEFHSIEGNPNLTS
jgi:hypothetical protein